MKTLLPDGSKLKNGEQIFRMQTPLRGQTLSVRPGPAQTLEQEEVAMAARIAQKVITKLQHKGVIAKPQNDIVRGLSMRIANLVKDGMELESAEAQVFGGFKSLGLASKEAAHRFALAPIKK